MENLGYVILLVVIALIAWVTARHTFPQPKPEPKPEPRRFGLREAEAAAKFVTTPGDVRPVLGVVVGVLGYENAVAADVSIVVESLEHEVSENLSMVDANNARISDLQASIRRLEALNAEAATHKTEFQRLAALFATK